MMNRVEDNQLHLLHVWISVFCQILLIYKNIDDFGNEIIAGFTFVVFLLDAALQGHWEIGNYQWLSSFLYYFEDYSYLWVIAMIKASK